MQTMEITPGSPSSYPYRFSSRCSAWLGEGSQQARNAYAKAERVDRAVRCR